MNSPSGVMWWQPMQRSVGAGVASVPVFLGRSTTEGGMSESTCMPLRAVPFEVVQ
jgi:hypothetical protein